MLEIQVQVICFCDKYFTESFPKPEAIILKYYIYLLFYT